MRLSEAIPLFSRWRSRSGKPGTAKGYAAELRIFCLYLRDPQAEDVGLPDVLGYFELMDSIGWDPATVERKAIAIRGFLGFLRSLGHRVLDPALVPLPDAPMKVPRVATADDVGKVVAAIPADGKDPRHVRNRAMVLMYRDSGCRLNELTALDLADVFPGRMKAVVRTEKSRGRRPFREVMWGEEAEAALAAWMERRSAISERKPFADPDALFVSVSGERHGMRFGGKGVAEMLRRYSNAAGIPYLNAHSLRHKRLHDVVKAGGSAGDVMNIAGHSSLASSTVYTMMFGDELEGRYRQLLGKD